MFFFLMYTCFFNYYYYYYYQELTSTARERQTALTIFVKLHFQQNSKYGQTPEFNISVLVCGIGWAITKIIVKNTMSCRRTVKPIIVKNTMSCRRTVKPQYNADLLFSKDQIVIKGTNAQILNHLHSLQ